MTLLQVIIVVAGLFIGYRLVSYMLSPGTGDDDKRSPPPFDPPDAAATVSARTWYQTLGVPETANRDTIENAYRQQIRQYHPDKVATMGEDIRRLAETRTKEINAAYDTAMRLRR